MKSIFFKYFLILVLVNKGKFLDFNNGMIDFHINFIHLKFNYIEQFKDGKIDLQDAVDFFGL